MKLHKIATILMSIMEDHNALWIYIYWIDEDSKHFLIYFIVDLFSSFFLFLTPPLLFLLLLVHLLIFLLVYFTYFYVNYFTYQYNIFYLLIQYYLSNIRWHFACLFMGSPCHPNSQLLFYFLLSCFLWFR